MIYRIETALRKLRRMFSRNEWLVKLFGLESHKATTGGYETGLVMVQIDGLGQHELERALAKGEMPFLAKLLRKEHYQKHSLYSGLPSSTPAVQGELFYGVKTAVPAFAFLGQGHALNRMYEPWCAAELESQLGSQGRPLLEGGSAYCNIYTGGAAESHFCAASLGWGDLLKGLHPMSWFAIALLNLPIVLRTLGSLLLELVLGTVDLIKGLYKGHRFLPEFKFIGARVVISILLRDLITMGAKVDIARGLPIVHLNYIGYDEQAHRRGPASLFAHWSLRGIDRSIESLWRTCHQAKDRHYDLWVYSDHGQQSTLPYERSRGKRIDTAVQRAFNQLANGHRMAPDMLNESRQHQRSELLGGNWTQKAVPVQRDEWDSAGQSAPAVIAMGPVGLIYFNQELGDDDTRLLAKTLVIDEGVPAAIYRDSQGDIQALTREESITLPAQANVLLGHEHPFLRAVTEDLMALVLHEYAGDMVILGWCHGQEAMSFPDENGAHAGVGPRETGAFALLPGDTGIDKSPDTAIRPLDLRKAALHLLGRETSEYAAKERGGLQNQNTLRVMTYNVHSCIGMDGKIAPERIARVIARYQPDIVALQELDVKKRRSHQADQAETIARLLEMNYHFHPAMHLEEEKYGDAILTHLPIVNCRAAQLPGHPLRSNAEPRGAIWVTLDFNGVMVQVLNTHLGLSAVERQKQIEALLGEQWLDHPDCKGSVVLCGDFNTLPNSPQMQSLRKNLSDVQTCLPGARARNTFTGRVPTLRIDHILFGNMRVTYVDVPANELTRVASDHLPLISDLVVD